MPFTSNKGLSVQTAGSNSGTWGAGASDALNEGVIELLDDIVGGLNTTALSSSNVTLTAAQGLHAIQRFTGTLTANVTITSPNVGFNLYENATTGNFTVTVQFTGAVGSTVIIPQGGRALVFADATNGVRFASQALAEAMILQRTANDTSEYEVLSLRSGNGSGNKGSLRIVGDGSNAVSQIRAYIGSTEIARLTTALALINIAFGVGSSIRIQPDGYFDLTEIAAPSNPSANVVRAYPVDESGTTNYVWRDSGGVISGLRVATAAEMETATSQLRTVSPGLQHRHPGHPKAGGNFNGSGTPAFASGDYGMGAITDNGTGNYTLALDTAFANTNYWLNGWSRPSSGGFGAVSGPAGGTKTSSSIQVVTSRGNDPTSTPDDSTEVGLTFWGDYA